MNHFTALILRISAILALGLASAQALAGHTNATVSFGQWMSSPPLDRFPNSSPRAFQDFLTPNNVTITPGSSVSFIIAGLHNIIIYDNGTQPSDINVALTRPTTGTPSGVPIIDDPNKRLYRGLDPSLQPRDRVEVVLFQNEGTYLVICGVLPHFAGGMYGFVHVKSDKVVPN